MNDAEIDEIGLLGLEFSKARTISRLRGLPQFLANCQEHGRTRHNTKTGRCVICHPNAPVGRPRSGSDRATARRRGEATYDAYCPTHIVTAFSTGTGKCLECFNALGRPRRALAGGRPATTGNARAEARRAGGRSYVAECPTHGRVAHSVGHGGCLTCLTTAGLPRRSPDPG